MVMRNLIKGLRRNFPFPFSFLTTNETACKIASMRMNLLCISLPVQLDIYQSTGGVHLMSLGVDRREEKGLPRFVTLP